MRQILALNSNYFPVKFIGAYSCIGKLYTGAAEAIIVHDNNIKAYTWNEWELKSKDHDFPEDYEYIHAITQDIAIPKTIRYLNYDKIPKQTVRLCRKNIYRRDNYVCAYCNKQMPESKLSVDHILPVALGGGNTWQNLITACKVCNNKKGHSLLADTSMKLHFQPFQPKTSNMTVLKSVQHTSHSDWSYFGV